VQVVIADVDANGRALSSSTSFALSGQVRAQGEGDDSLNRLATKAGCKLEVCCAPAMKLVLTRPILTSSFSVLRNVWSYQK